MAKNNNHKNNPWELDQQSLDYLVLSKQPFADEILTEQTFFLSQALKKIIESLTHQVQFSDLLLIVEGTQGSGKTSLYRQFIQLDITNTKILSIQAEATDTLTQIQQKMSLHLQDLGDANHLEDNLKSLQTFDQVPVLVMDNSHVLSDTTLQELFRFQQQLQQEQEVTLKVLLFANTGMSDTIQKITDISTEQMYVQSIPALSPKQVERFLFHKLRQAGYSGEKILDEKSLQQIIRKSSAGLSSIMQTAAPVIDRIVARKLKPGLSSNLKLTFIILLLGVLITAAVAWLYLMDDSEPDTAVVAPQTESPQPRLYVEPEPPETVSPEPMTSEPVGSETAPESIVESIVEPLAEPPRTDMAEAGAEQSADQAEASPASRPEETAQQSQPAAIVPAASTPATSITETTTAAPAIAAAPIAITEPATRPTPPPTSVTRTAAPVIKPAATTSSLAPALRQLGAMGIADASWLTQQPNSNWTLQLLGAREPETLLKFARRHRLSSQTAWYKTWLKSKPYYVLVHGSFSSRDQARNAIGRLSPALQANKPWVKSMRSVQQAIK